MTIVSIKMVDADDWQSFKMMVTIIDANNVTNWCWWFLLIIIAGDGWFKWCLMMTIDDNC